MSRLYPQKRVPKKPPPDDPANLRGRIVALMHGARQKATVDARDGANYEKALAKRLRAIKLALASLRGRLAKAEGPEAQTQDSEGGILETLKSL